jgi:hypothetical protein
MARRRHALSIAFLVAACVVAVGWAWFAVAAGLLCVGLLVGGPSLWRGG